MKFLTTRSLIVVMCLALVLLTIGCSTWRKLDNTEKGAVVGTGSGALIGGAAAGTGGALIGGAAGGLGGGVIGNQIDRNEHRR